MEPGSILVCPITTPAWTPLFAQARGLVTDVGGILAHGSIVAREYGIPAAMGTGRATRWIAHGQTITVDGDRGEVKLEELLPGERWSERTAGSSELRHVALRRCSDSGRARPGSARSMPYWPEHGGTVVGAARHSSYWAPPAALDTTERPSTRPSEPR
jgi:phosphohistidine swiveling domain-containing protein